MYPYENNSGGGYGYQYSGGMAGYQPPQPTYGGGYGSFTPQAQTQYSYGGGSGGLGELESMLMSQFKRQSQNQMEDEATRKFNMLHYQSPFTPVRPTLASLTGYQGGLGQTGWNMASYELANQARALAGEGGSMSGENTMTGEKYSTTYGKAAGGSGSGSGGAGGGGGGAGIGDLISLYGLRQQGANSAADRALASQKMQAELQIAREQNAMSQWATYMDMQNAEQNRLAQMEQQRRGFLDNAYGRQDQSYYDYGIA
jgi:hypothetical protein